MTSDDRPLDPPLAVAWDVTPFTARVDTVPQFDGHHVIVAAGGTLTALAPGDGAIRWQLDTGVDATNLALARDAALVSGFTKADSHLVCADSDGAVRWRQDGWSISGDSLGRDGDDFVVLGRRGDDETLMCRVLRADTGDQRIAFVCHASTMPDRVSRGFVYSGRSTAPEYAGLFVYDLASERTEHLHQASHGVRSRPADSIVVFDTRDYGVQGELVAVDVASRAVLWSGVGGINIALAVDRGQLLATESRGESDVTLTLREIQSGRLIWRSDPFSGSDAEPILLGDLAIVCIDAHRLMLFDRATGAAVQTMDLWVSAWCPTPLGLFCVDEQHVRCLRHSGAR